MSGRGRLVLKGHGAVSKVGGMKRPRAEEPVPAQHQPAAAAASEAPLPAAPSEAALERHPCTGLLYTSGTAVTGQGTAFKSELRAGDVVELLGQADARPVSFVLSDTSLSLREAFLKDIAPPGLAFVAVRRAGQQQRAGGSAGGGGSGGGGAAEQAAGSAAKELESVTGVSAVSMRVNKAGSKGVYTTAAVQGGQQLSREELLDLRIKGKGEKLL